MRWSAMAMGCASVMAVAGCKGPASPQADPATSTSAATSGSTVASVAVSASTSANGEATLLVPYRCEEGKLLSVAPAAIGAGRVGTAAPSDSESSMLDAPRGESLEGAGGLRISGPDTGAGRGEGIGLGSIGTGRGSGVEYGADLGPLSLYLSATLNAPAGAAGLGHARTLCGATSAMTQCAEKAALPRAAWPKKSILTLTTKGDGSVERARLAFAEEGASAVAACIERLVEKLSFPASAATVSYAIDWTLRAPRTAKLLERSVEISGRLPPEVVRRILRASYPRLRRCYESLRERDPNARGTLVGALVIIASGSVASARLSGGTLTDESFGRCAGDLFRSLSFPKSEGGSVKVDFAYGFDAPSP